MLWGCLLYTSVYHAVDKASNYGASHGCRRKPGGGAERDSKKNGSPYEKAETAPIKIALDGGGQNLLY